MEGRAITKNEYTRTVWSQKRVHRGIKYKIQAHEPREWPKTNSKWLFFLVLVLAFNRSWCVFSQPLAYSCYNVLCFSQLLLSLFSFWFLLFFWLIFALGFFTTSFISLYLTIMHTCVRTSTYSYVQTMHVYITTTAVLSVDSFFFFILTSTFQLNS